LNILIYSVNPQSPHLETELELALKFKERGDKVTVVRCTGQLRSCLVNPNHNLLICASCKSKYQNAMELSRLADVKMITPPLTNYSYKDIPKSFANIEELKAFKFQGADLGVSIVSTLVGRFSDHKFDTLKYQKEIYIELRMCIDIYLGFEQILVEIKPDKVYFFNGRFSSYYPLKWLCIKNNITFFTHERGGVINKYILRKNTMPHDIEYARQEMEEHWSTIQQDKEQIGAKFFVDRRNRVIQSWMSFTESQKKGLLPIGFDQKKKNIVIFNSTMEEYEGMEGWRNPIYEDDNDGIRRILESFKEERDYIFYLRVHPNMKLLKNTQMREIEHMAKKYNNLYLIKPEDECDTYTLMDYADKVITFGSTAGVEATFWNRISILLGKSLYMDIDVCYQPSCHEDVIGLVKSDNLLPKKKINAIKYGYWELTKGEYFVKFKQLDLFTMAFNDKVIEANKVLRIFEKFAKLRLIRDKRGVDTLKKKMKNLIGW
jgi:hypothetical protein